MPIIAPNQILLMSLYFGENLPNFPSIVQFLFKEIGTFVQFYHGKSPRGRANHFRMDIRIMLDANNGRQTDFSDETLFLRKYAQLTIYRTFSI